MVFKENDKKTKEAGRKGGKTGMKHISKMTKKQRSEFSKKALDARWAANRTDKLMRSYHDFNGKKKKWESPI